MCIKITIFFSDLTPEMQEEKITDYISNKYSNDEYTEIIIDEENKKSLVDIINDEEYRAEARESIERCFPIIIN